MTEYKTCKNCYLITNECLSNKETYYKVDDKEYIIDNECFRCKRYVSGSCKGVADRKREYIDSMNQCSGFLDVNKPNEFYK